MKKRLEISSLQNYTLDGDIQNRKQTNVDNYEERGEGEG